MRYAILLTIIWTFTLGGYAQTHVRQVVDGLIAGHPEWVVSTVESKSGTQSSHVYLLSMPDQSAIDSLLVAFDADKMEGYNYIRTSSAYNQARRKHRRQTVTLQNGERLDSHSTEYSFVSLSVVDPSNGIYRTNYILKWYLPKNGRTEAKLYILYGSRPNNHKE